MSSDNERSVPQLDSQINYWVLALIASLAIGFQLWLYFVGVDTDTLELTDVVWFLTSFSCGIGGIIIAKKYSGSEVFAKAYLALGLGYIFYSIGNLVWTYYEIVLKEYPYPSYADVFYIATPPLLIFHLVTNIRYFKKKIKIQVKVILYAIAVIITLFYGYYSFIDYGELSFEFFLGLLNVALAAIVLSLAVLGAIVFRNSVLGAVWLLLVSGNALFTVAEVNYYFLELGGLYDGNHPVNSLYILSFMVITYALYKHGKIL